MKTARVTTILIAAAFAAGIPFGAAAMEGHHHGHGHGAAASQTEMRTVAGEGEVKAVAAAEGRITIAHGPMPELNWPPMVMDFDLADPALAEQAKVGAAVRFTIRERAPLDFVVIDLAPAGHRH